MHFAQFSPLSPLTIASEPRNARPRQSCDGFSGTRSDLESIFAFADARGIQDELFHVVVERWRRERAH
jgi:hypothetical protein